jgi:hypothetical protein
MNRTEKGNHPLSEGSHQKERIETQIHRRRKVKALSPLESEWVSPQPGPFPHKLSDETGKAERSMPDCEFQEAPHCSTFKPLPGGHT